MGLAIGPVSRFMTRRLYALLETRQSSWGDVLEIGREARQELEVWKGSPAIWHSPSEVRVVYSDASDTGYGGLMANVLRVARAQRSSAYDRSGSVDFLASYWPSAPVAGL